MSNPVKLAFGAAVLALALGAFNLYKVLAPVAYVGGVNHNVQENFISGLKVNGTEVISAARAITGTQVISINGSSTSTLKVGSSAAAKAGAVCVWNGASYTIIRYASNATTTAFTTSTSCQ